MDNNNNIITEHIDWCNEHTIYPEYFSTIIQNGKRLYRHRNGDEGNSYYFYMGTFWMGKYNLLEGLGKSKNMWTSGIAA